MVWEKGRIWNPKLSPKEASGLAWSIYDGCGGNLKWAKLYFCVCCEESGLKPINNPKAFGYSGGHWKTIFAVMKRQGHKQHSRLWYKRHPFFTNQLLARHFTYFCNKIGPVNALRTWNKGGNWKAKPKTITESWKYTRKVYKIKRAVDS